MPLGFGTVEQEFVAAERQAIQQWLDEHAPVTDGPTEWPHGTVEQLYRWLAARGKEFAGLASDYDESEKHPDRYSWYLVVDVMQSHMCLCVLLRFIHQNRRHALAQDGWAMTARTVPMVFTCSKSMLELLP